MTPDDIRFAVLSAAGLAAACLWPLLAHAQLGPAPGVSQSNLGVTQIRPAGTTMARPLSAKLGDSASVRDFGAMGDGVTDDTAAINAAAAAVPASGGTLLLPPGNYLVRGISVNNAILLHSNTTMRCEGATITAGGPNANTLALVQNINYSARVLTDHDIKVTGCNFVYPNWQVGQIGKAIQFWWASHINVLNNSFVAGAGATEMLGSYDVNIEGNSSVGATNASYDQFWGGSKFRIINNFADVAANSTINSFGIQVTATDVDNAPTPMSDFVIANNVVIKAGDVGAPISLNGHCNACSINGAIITGNRLSVAPGANAGGILLDESGSNTIISGNVIDGTLLQPAISSMNGLATNTTVTGNVISNCGYAAPYVANIELHGLFNTIAGNRGIGCTGQFISAVGAQNTIEANDDGTGPDGAAFSSGTVTGRVGAFGALGAATVATPSVQTARVGPSSGVGAVTTVDAGVFWTPPVLTVAPPASGAAAQVKIATYGLSSAGIAQQVSQGQGGYTLGEGLIPVGGVLPPGGSPAVVQVTGVDASGNPTGIQAYSAGSYSVLPPNPATFTAAHGSGFSSWLSYYAASVAITNPGSGYGSAPAIAAANCVGTGGLNQGCGTFTAALAPATVSYTGIPLCSAAATGQLCAASAAPGAAVQVK